MANRQIPPEIHEQMAQHFRDVWPHLRAMHSVLVSNIDGMLHAKKKAGRILDLTEGLIWDLINNSDGNDLAWKEDTYQYPKRNDWRIGSDD